MSDWLPLESRHGIRPTSGQGVIRDGYPACSKHGHMLRVHPRLRMFRCMSDEWTCNVGLVHRDDALPETGENNG